MIRSKYRISLDLHDTTSQASIRIVEGDISRKLIFNLTEDGKPYSLTEDCYAVLAATKPDGTMIFNDTVNRLDSVEYDVTSQTVSKEGMVHCQLWIYGKDGECIASPLFTILVTQKVFDDSVIESTDEFSALQTLIEETANIKASEEGRVEAEKTRAQSESSRLASESIRISNEQTRTSAEAVRVSNETKREQAYTEVTEAEALRASAEATRIQNEETRIANETERERAVTELLTQSTAVQLNSRIDRCDKRITNLEKGIPSEQFVTDSSVAYTKYVPANALPYAEVGMIGGMTRKSVNLLDLHSVYWSSASPKVEGETLTVTGYIAMADFRNLKIGYTYHFTAKSAVTGDGGGGVSIICYDVNGAVLDAVYKANEQNPAVQITIPSGTVKTSICLYGSKTSNGTDTATYTEVMFNEGSTALPYEPYYEGLRSVPVTDVKSVGANIFGGDALADRLVEVAGAVKDEETGIVRFNANNVTGKLLHDNFKPNTQYTFILNGWNEYSAGTNLLVKYTDDTVDYLPFPYSQALGTTVFHSREGKSIKGFYGVAYASYTNLYYNKCGIFEGAITAEEFKPYREEFLILPEAVTELNGYGDGVNESVYNYIVFEKQQFVKRVGCVDMGTLGWGKIGNMFRADGSALGYKYGWNGACSKYDIVYKKEVDKSIYMFDSYYGEGKIAVWDSAYTDVETFKSAMSGIMLYYELAEPIVTDISDILPSDNFIGVEGKGTLTFNNEYKYAVPSEVSYQLKEA